MITGKLLNSATVSLCILPGLALCKPLKNCDTIFRAPAAAALAALANALCILPGILPNSSATACGISATLFLMLLYQNLVFDSPH